MARTNAKSAAVANPHKVVGKESRSTRRMAVERKDGDDDEDDDVGRSALGRSKRIKNEDMIQLEADPAVTGDQEASHRALRDEGDLARPSKRASSFLDVMLAEKSHKRRRKLEKKKASSS